MALTDTKSLIARFERQAHRLGELWERCHGKGWSEEYANEFKALRDERVPATRAALEAIESAAVAPLLARIAALEAQVEQAAQPVAAQHRFRHPQKTMPGWSTWQSCAVSDRPAWQIDSQGYEVEYRALYTSPPKAAPLTDEQHPDDAAVDHFSVAMKAKLSAARAKGRGGWENCDPYVLSDMLRAHVEKGDPRDVANFCMFLHMLGHGIYKPSIQPDLAAMLQELDTPIAGHLGSHSGKFVPGASKYSNAFDAFESAIPLVRWEDHERSCRKIAALSEPHCSQPTQLQMLSEFEEGTLAIEHMGPSALAGDSMSLMDAFDKGLKAGQSALAAKNGVELK
ncbi:hypothetical protein F3K02_09230 [Hydrogenophaga sp. D2P1]|uniref:Uncharacterized protein n=1 Tax=Hydrogenophaga aromaticivorans TaxID=2610898 RepID=A0A7Y8GVZ5_9BURK|nr:hypothetical protein [Hydrogenophaga aromaticivorans]NWF45428.1 hypothetical protein [Hydrogenophaga aromaticivorans]